MFRGIDRSVGATVGTGSGITLRALEGMGGMFLRTGATPKTGSALDSTSTLGVVRGLAGRNGSTTRVCMRRNHRSLTSSRLTRMGILRACLPGRVDTRRLRTTLGRVVTRINTADNGSVNGIVNMTDGGLTKLTRNHTVSTGMGRLLKWEGALPLSCGPYFGEKARHPGSIRRNFLRAGPCPPPRRVVRCLSARCVCQPFAVEYGDHCLVVWQQLPCVRAIIALCYGSHCDLSWQPLRRWMGLPAPVVGTTRAC